MNDFTKEELELIRECIESDYYQTDWPQCMYDPLIYKLQSMIDNYCEHSTYRDYISAAGSKECVYCGRIW